jgi:hypothetical protein
MLLLCFGLYLVPLTIVIRPKAIIRNNPNAIKTSITIIIDILLVNKNKKMALIEKPTE